MAAARWALVAVAASLLLSSPDAAAGAPTAAAEAANAVLRAHQLPGGLLPAGITVFRYDAGTGRFEARLAAPCTARFDVGLRYNATVAGVISKGQIAAISGVSAKDLFIWLPLQDIKVDIPSTGVIYLNFGVVKKHLPLAVFDAAPPCTPETDTLRLRTATLQLPQLLEDVSVGVDGLAMGGVASQ